MVANRNNKYPIKVIVTAEHEDGTKQKLWQGRQQDLFSKNSSKRKKSMEEIAAKAKELRQQSEEK